MPIDIQEVIKIVEQVAKHHNHPMAQEALDDVVRGLAEKEEEYNEGMMKNYNETASSN